MNDINLDKNEYRVLARKYRPQVFSDLIGQDTLVQTLTNAISSNRIAHAYILTGVRGVGKTTTARLISMSLNCEDRNNDSFEPCGKCKVCISISGDHNLDVIEMDAASKTGVDDIREIIDNVKYKPINCKYKIFIIDEVHMLSKSAFNALLKTLEEPPPHIKFIFATTEIKKIPVTIISRCQKFDLQRIDDIKLTSHLSSIASKENININKDALALIVRASEGSVRDGLSLLDQAIANEKNNITSKSVTLMLGLADRGNIFNLLDSVFKGDTNSALKIYNETYLAGADVIMIFDEMLKVTHFLTQLKILPDIKNDSHIPEFERKKGNEIVEKISLASLNTVWQVLFKGYQELQTGFHLFQHGEMIIIRLIYLFDGPTPEDLVKKVEEKLQNSTNKRNDLEFQDSNKNKTPPIINKNLETKESLSDKSENSFLKVNSYRQFVDLFFQKREAMIHTLLYNNAKNISFKEGELIINIEKIKDPHFLRTVAKFASKWTGRIWQVSSSTSNLGKTLYEEDLLNQQKQIDIMKNDEEIKKILQKYPDSKIHSISDIGETSDDKISNSNSRNKKEQ